MENRSATHECGRTHQIEAEHEDIIPIFFSVVEAYAPLTTVATESIAESASPDRAYRVFVMYEEMNRLTRKRIARQNLHIVFIPMADRIEEIVDVMGNRLRADDFNRMIFYRLFIPAMFSEYDKSIYHGIDAVVPGDIARFYGEDLYDDLIGACLTSQSMVFPSSSTILKTQ